VLATLLEGNGLEVSSVTEEVEEEWNY